jgi:hypothetical protein
MNLAQTGLVKKKHVEKKEWIDTAIKKARPRSASDPDLKATFTMDLLPRNRSHSPPLFPLSGFDYWNEPLVLYDGTRDSERVPHPHHYDHPEKHVLDAIGRSLTSLSDLSIARSRTPPSPHHFDAPLNTILHNGQPKERKSVNAAREMERKGIHHMKKKPATAGTPKTLIDIEERKSRPNTAKSDDRKIRWDSDHVGVRNRHWNARPNQITRLANDQTIDTPTDKQLLEKKKGEFVHVPLGRIKMDMTSLFMGSMDATASIGSVVQGIKSCELKVSLDSHLLSEKQQIALNPMMITLLHLSDMPSEPVDFKTLDSQCLPV